jgi:hypothetical protein
MDEFHSIKIDDEVLELLKDEAEPFVDTPNAVLRRLLRLDSNGPKPSAEDSVDETARPRRRSRRAPSSKRSARRARAPAGSLLEQDAYVEPILRAVQAKEGRAPTREVLDEVGKILADRFTELDRERTETGIVRWENRAQFARLRMVDRGLLKKNSPRGVWEISNEGIAYLNGDRRER